MKMRYLTNSLNKKQPHVGSDVRANFPVHRSILHASSQLIPMLPFSSAIICLLPRPDLWRSLWQILMESRKSFACTWSFGVRIRCIKKDTWPWLRTSSPVIWKDGLVTFKIFIYFVYIGSYTNHFRTHKGTYPPLHRSQKSNVKVNYCRDFI